MNRILIVFAILFSFTLHFHIIAQEADTTTRYDQYGQKVDRLPLTAEARNGIITFESKDKSFKFWTDFRINFDGGLFFDNYDNSLSPAGNKADAIQLSNGFHIRRLRMAFKAQVTEKWYGEMDIDFRDAEIDLNDVYLKYSPNEKLDFKFGHFREPFGMMTNTTSRYVTFMERPASCEFDPSRHMGIASFYAHPRFYTGFGVFSDEFIEAVDGGTRDVRRKERTGTESSLAFTGKFVGYPINKNDFTLAFGVSGSYRTPMITDEGAYNVARFKTYDEIRTSQKRFFDTDVISDVKNIILTNAEFAFAYKSFRIQSEYHYTIVKRGQIYDDVPKAGLKDAKFDGFYVEAAAFLTGDKQNFNYGEAEFTRVRPKSSKGAIELAARYSTINLNANLDYLGDQLNEKLGNVVTGGSGALYSLGLTWWAKNNVRIILNGTYVDHDEYAQSKYNWKVPEGGFDYIWLGSRFEIDF
ncbi:MAG: OprO/OprP family phosphate-selective porin [Deltaproteobacteria bacterium]